MPTVPVINQNLTNTPEVQAPNVRPMENYAPQQLERTGETMQNAGLREMSVGQHVALRIQEQMDDANVKAAEGKFIEASTAAVTDYMTKQGADALNGYDSASQAIIKAKKDVMESLGNDIQKSMFERVSQQHLVTFGARMAEHRAQQRTIYTKSESLSRAENMRAMAQNSDLGSQDHATYLSAGVAEIHNAFKDAGPEAQAKAERDYRTQVVGDDITRLMVANRYDDAKTLLSEQVKAGNVDPDSADRLRATIQTNVERVEAIDTADKIFASRKGLDAKDLEDLLVKVDGQVKDPELRQHVRQLVASQFSQARSIQEQKYNDNLKDVVNFKYEHGSLKGIDPVKWGMLDAKDRYELSKPPAIETDLNTWYGFITKPDTLTLDNVRNAYMRGLLSTGDFKSFTERAMELAKQTNYVQDASAINQRVDYFANQAGMNIYGNKNTDDKVQHGVLTYRVNQEIDRVKAQNKGKITSDQVDQIIKKELTQQTLSLPRSPWNPLTIIGFPTKDEQKFTFQMPAGATMVVPGSDGKMHYSDGKNDLGTVE